MLIIWNDIWDVQSGSKAKSPINRCFNVERFITTIQEANMNLGVSQYKNYWQWGHMTLSCHIQEFKCIKYNGPYKTENHHQFGWCCKVNEKINPPHLEIKKGELCLCAPIVVEITKQTPIYVHSEGIGSITSSTSRSITRSVKTGQPLFT